MSPRLVEDAARWPLDQHVELRYGKDGAVDASPLPAGKMAFDLRAIAKLATLRVKDSRLHCFFSFRAAAFPRQAAAAWW